MNVALPKPTSSSIMSSLEVDLCIRNFSTFLTILGFLTAIFLISDKLSMLSPGCICVLVFIGSLFCALVCCFQVYFGVFV